MLRTSTYYEFFSSKLYKVASPSTKTKELLAHGGASPNHFPQHQVVLIDPGPDPPLSGTPRQRKLARLHTFIAHELYRTQQKIKSSAEFYKAGFCLGCLSDPVVRKQLLWSARRRPKKQLETPFSYYFPRLNAIVWNQWRSVEFLPVPSFHGLLLCLFPSNEEDEREELIELSISSVLIRCGEEGLEVLLYGMWTL